MRAKRALAVILAASMVFGSVGCMKKNEANKPAGKKEKREAVAVPEDIWEPYEEEVVINMAVPENSTYVFKDGDDYDNNPWYRAYKERFNIQVKNKWVSADYSTKLNLAIAEGDLPDVFVVNAKRLKELQEADLIWDLTEVFEKNAGDNLMSYREQYPDIFETGKIDGKMYGIASLNMGAMDYIEQLWVRKDIKEAAGFAEGTQMKTIEDLEKFANYAKEQGMYAFTDSSDMYGLYALATSYGVYPWIWTEQADGELGYGSVQPEMKQVLAKYNQWYNEGVLDPNFTTSDLDKMNEALINKEAAAAFTGNITWGVGPTMVEKFDPSEYFEAYAMPTVTGEPAKSGIPFQNWGYIVVSKDCPNPDAVVRCLNFYTYFMDDAGENPEEDPEELAYLTELRNMPASMRVYNPDTEARRAHRISDNLFTTGAETDTSTWGADATSFKKCLSVLDGDPTYASEYMAYAGPTSKRGVGVKAVEEGNVVKSAIWGASTEKMSQLGGTLDSILLEGFTKIVVGEQPVDYFDTLVEEWNAAGGEELTEEVNNVYGK